MKFLIFFPPPSTYRRHLRWLPPLPLLPRFPPVRPRPTMLDGMGAKAGGIGGESGGRRNRPAALSVGGEGEGRSASAGDVNSRIFFKIKLKIVFVIIFLNRLFCSGGL